MYSESICILSLLLSVCVVLVMAVCACDGRVMFFIFCFHLLIIFGNRLCQPWAV